LPMSLSVIVKIPERPRNPDFSRAAGSIIYLCARLWIVRKKHASDCYLSGLGYASGIV
jgi:hypothetical protein